MQPHYAESFARLLHPFAADGRTYRVLLLDRTDFLMLTGIIAALLWVAFETPGTVVLDRIAVVVGKRVVKTSDIDRELPVTAFLNREPLNLKRDARKKAVDRLVDQQIIRNEIATGEYPRASESDADKLLNQIRASRFAGTEARLTSELGRYGLSEAQLRDHLLWQLTVLRFIDERFR